MGKGYAIDLLAAVSASQFAPGIVKDPEIKEASERSAVPTAILLAMPVKA
ncbi:MAG: hypothetical protein K2Y56_01205 [Methylobacterium sp.]|nr:hypothetical protein [Methylobacterium sp.]MBX9930151.1 hypothetical protein [Methylobacterium sp.]